VVARPCEACWEARRTIWIVCGHFAAQGAKGEAEYPYCCLGGIGEVSMVDEQERHGARG
jgi:hypothetical protein